jgi:hypothetical protein
MEAVTAVAERVAAVVGPLAVGADDGSSGPHPAASKHEQITVTQAAVRIGRSAHLNTSLASAARLRKGGGRLGRLKPEVRRSDLATMSENLPAIKPPAPEETSFAY